MRPLTDLCRLAIKHQSDKGGRHLTYGGENCHATHEYTPLYSDLLSRQRHLVRAVLEIGVNRGCGLRMWEEYFPAAQIIGLDINKECLFNTGRIETFYADQSSPASLTHAVAIAGHARYDLIVDDGSHQMMDQAITMATLLPYLSDIGVYVIEDIPRDQNWAGHLARTVPDGYHYGLVFPPLAHGDGWPEQLFVVTRE